MAIKAALIPVGEKPRLIEIEPEDGKCLRPLQNLVHGLIEPYDVLYGSTPLLWVNEEGIYTEEPNRAIYANRHAVAEGYISQFGGQDVVKPGELMAILHGDIVAVSYDIDEYGEEIERDITDEEFERLCKDFDDPMTGYAAAMAIRILREKGEPCATPTRP